MKPQAPPPTWSWSGAIAAPAVGWAATDGRAGAASAVHTLHGQSMGTRWSVKLAVAPAALAALQRGVQAALDEVVAQMSTWEADSAISRFNRAAAGSEHALPAGFAQVLEAALALAAATNGAYDPTVGPLTDVWGFGPSGPRAQAPASAPLAQARERVDWRRLDYDPSQRRLRQPGGAYLDLSSIAKGFGVDQAARWLLAQGVDDCLVEVGGELRGHGRKPDGSSWRVAIEQPGAGADQAAAVIALDGLSVATSGDYRRFFDAGGRRYSHTLDPRSGAPIDNEVASVTVLHPDCMHADALATALTVLGARAGLAHANRHGLAALFVLREGDAFTSRATPAFVARQVPA